MLYVVATPIGNLGDITLRALDTLRECDLIAAEDTRYTGRLLQHYEIHKPLISLHDHNEIARTPELLERLKQGIRIALVTDAGTPILSDPGFRLVRACREAGIACTVLPGASAITAAVAGSGLPPMPFSFHGFLPVKSGRRANALATAVAADGSTVFFESPHRLVKTLAQLAADCPEARVCVARELTKHFEEYRNGSPAELFAHYSAHPPKGEITLVIAAPARKSDLASEETV